MGIRHIPATVTRPAPPAAGPWRASARHMDAYERAHFGFDAGGRDVAESTLALLATFPPHHRIPAALDRQFSLALMDGPLLDAFGFRRPGPVLRALARGGLKARGRVVRFLPPRTQPYFARQMPQIRSYPDGYEVARLGTFPPGCPVPEPGKVAVTAATRSPERAG